MPPITRILLAEADLISRQLLTFSLQREGYEVVPVQGGLDVLRKVRESHIDLVLSEAILPDMDGMELCKQLRADLNTAHLPIVLVTSKGSSEDRIAGLSAGADDYLVKPYDVRELLIRLRRLISTYSNCYSNNPLTRLPAGPVIEKYVTRMCETDRDWALLHVDLNHFSEYNQLYGFTAGNRVLREVAGMLRGAIMSEQDEVDFLGHDGRDDFIAVVSRNKGENLCKKLIQMFEERVPDFYPPEHRESKYGILIDRIGKTISVPRLTLAIGVLTNDLCEDLDYLEKRHNLQVVLKQAKNQTDSGYFLNRRQLVGRQSLAPRHPNDAASDKKVNT